MNWKLVWGGAAIVLLTILATSLFVITIMYRLIESLGFEKGLLTSFPIFVLYALIWATLLWLIQYAIGEREEI